MKISIIAASGKQGKCLVKEAVARGHEVTAIVRDASKMDGFDGKVVQRDIFDITYDDLKDSDAVIDAFGTAVAGEHQTSLRHLTDILSGKPNRLLVVGGAGSLYTDKKNKVRVVDAPDFPDAWKPTAQSMAKALDELMMRDDVQWTFLSPAAFFMADGERTGKYKIGSDELILNSAGKSEISYADYAIAMIDEVEKGDHIKKRFTVVSI